MTIGKNVLNRRKKTTPNDRGLAIDFNGSIQFIHEMSGGETEFDLQELTLPSGSGSFMNPTAETIRSINLGSVRERIKLFNGQGKAVPYGLHFEVLGTKIILKGIEAEVGEIFFGEIRNLPRQNIAFLDGRQNQITKFLPVGETEINLGFSVPISDIDTNVDRLGPCEVFRQKEPMYLNTEAETPVTTTDGDYSFVPDGSGSSSVIRFNDAGVLLPGGLLEFISVKRNQISVDKEDASLRGEVEVLSGAMDRMADEISAIQSIPKTDLLNFSPNRQQLNQFGDIVQGILGLEVVSDLQWQHIWAQAIALTEVGLDVEFNTLGNFNKVNDDLIDIVNPGNNRTEFRAKQNNTLVLMRVAGTSTTTGSYIFINKRNAGGSITEDTAMDESGGHTGVDLMGNLLPTVLNQDESLSIQVNGGFNGAIADVSLVAKVITKNTIRNLLGL